MVRERERISLAPLDGLLAAIKKGAKTFAEAGGDDAYFGDPTAASAEEGENIFEALGEILSLGGFYKRLNDPIEIVRIPTAGNNVGTPEPYNGPSAHIYGVELELRNDLGRWTRFHGLSASTNLTLASSSVKQDEPTEVSSETRPRQSPTS